MRKGIYLSFTLKRMLAVASFMALGILTVAIAGIFGSKASVSSARVTEEKPLIIIDAGHGGEDGGTQSSSGILEKDINLNISLKLNYILVSLGYKTILIRDEDKMIYGDGCSTQREKKVSDIKNRMAVIEENPNSIFLSIHQNYYSQSKYKGAQVFYSPNNEKSMLIAESVQKSIVKFLQNDNERKIKKSGKEIYLLYHAKSPAVMVECGFMSNPGEALLLNDESYQKKMALAIAAGVTQYIKGE